MKYLSILLILLCMSCKSQQEVVNATTQETKIVETAENSLSSIFIVDEIDIVADDLRYKLKNTIVKENTIMFDVSYGGGCKKPHDFVLHTTGNINENGLMEIYLMDKTHGDLCKMLLMEQHFFDISAITNLDSEKLKGFLINKETEYLFK